MPLSPEVLESVRRSRDEAIARAKSIEDVIEDLAVTSVDTSKWREQLRETKERIRELNLFYEKQSKRVAGK